MQRPTTLWSDDAIDPLEDHPLFTPDLEYFTPSMSVSLNNTNAYQARTLTPYNMERQTILPTFPPSPFFANVNDHQPLLLLSSVPSMINIRLEKSIVTDSYFSFYCDL